MLKTIKNIKEKWFKLTIKTKINSKKWYYLHIWQTIVNKSLELQAID